MFQAPNPWIFAPPRRYLVNEIQKAEILKHLGRWRLMALISLLAMMVLTASLIAFVTLHPATFVRLVEPARQLGFGPSVALTFIVMAPFIALFDFVPQIYLIRGLWPLLADASRTEERIRFGEQLPKIAASLSAKLLAVGIICGLGMIGCGALLVLDAFSGATLRLYGSFLVFAGGLLTSYFAHLARLKVKNLRRAAL